MTLPTTYLCGSLLQAMITDGNGMEIMYSVWIDTIIKIYYTYIHILNDVSSSETVIGDQYVCVLKFLLIIILRKYSYSQTVFVGFSFCGKLSYIMKINICLKINTRGR